MIPLLSPKPFEEYDPTSFKEYVRYLFAERKKKKSAAKKKRLRDFKLTIKRTKTGKISAVTRRPLKYFTADELIEAAERIEAPQSELFITLRDKGFIQATHEEAKEINGEINNMPF